MDHETNAVLIRIKTVTVVLIVAGAVLLFAAIAADVLHAGRLAGIDVQVGDWFRAHRVPALTPFVLLFTHLHGTIGVSVLGLALAFLLVRKRQGDWLLTLVIALPCGMLINTLLKNLFMRERPEMGPDLPVLSTYSFPSGHVAAATLFYGVLAAAWGTAWVGLCLIGVAALKRRRKPRRVRLSRSQ